MVVERSTWHVLLFATILFLCSQYDKAPAHLYQRYQQIRPQHRVKSRRLANNATAKTHNGTAETSATEEDDVYKGPGKKFGMVLLITSVALWVVFTFGSIAIGNYILSKNALDDSEE
mmetsp:Transcript_16862/g.32510  ORF Transcript_16862/g.32510 Transcript_16862/m.32510 type:complete len:117 (-) Transcript_16862:212-562(-)